MNTLSPISQQLCYSKISLHSRNRQIPKNQLNANSETAQKDKTYKTGTRLWVKPKVSCTRQTSLLQRTKTKFNKHFKWIILDKNSGTNHMGKYIESLSFYVYKSLQTVHHKASKILKIATLKNKTKGNDLTTAVPSIVNPVNRL